MPFAFRLRFLTATGFTSDAGTFEFPGPGGETLRMEATTGGKPGDAKWLAVRNGGYKDESQARDAAEALRQELLVVGTLRRIGFEFGHDEVTGGMGKGFREQVEAERGVKIRNSVHGIDVFEEGSVRETIFVDAGGTLTVSTSVDMFFSELERVRRASPSLSRRHVVAMELLNQSCFPASTDAQFLARISSIEVLCKRTKRPQAQRDALDELAESLSHIALDPDAREQLRQHVLYGKKVSIAEACREAVRGLLGPSRVADFERLYKARSELIHAGKGRRQTAELAIDAQSLATDLLRADLKI